MDERIFKGSKNLERAWEEMGTTVPWWFDTVDEEDYDKADTLDGMGVPIVWDDEDWSVEDIKEGTGDDLCALVLRKDREQVLILINRELPHILSQESPIREIEWEDYTREGLWAVKKLYPDFKLEAVVINPRIKTLDKIGVLQSIIRERLGREDILNGGDNGSLEGQAGED